MYPSIILLLSLALILQTSKVNEASLRPVRVNGRVGYIDQTGKFVIKPQFEEAWEFSERLAPFRIRNKWGYINPNGKIVIPAQFYQAMPFSEGLAPVGIFFEGEKVIDSRVGETGFIDKTGRVAIKQQFAVALGFSNGFARVLTLDNKHGYIDKAGNFISEDDAYDKELPIAFNPSFEWNKGFGEGLVCAYEKGKAGFVDVSKNTVIEFRFEDCRKFSEGLAAARLDSKWGYINKAGNFVIQPQFAEAKEFSEGAAVVSLVENGKYGAIDKNGRLFIQPRFIELSAFRGGIAWANLTNSIVVDGEPDDWAYINNQGDIIWRTTRRNTSKQ